MPNIIKEILKSLPEEKISEACFEGANIVLYTKDKEFFLNNEGAIRKVVDEIKKRIELRSDPSILMEQELAEQKIRQLMPEEAGVPCDRQAGNASPGNTERDALGACNQENPCHKVKDSGKHPRSPVPLLGLQEEVP